MPKNINLVLDPVRVDKTYKVSGYTDVNWAPGCITSLVFRPWHGFKKVISDGVDAIESVQNIDVEMALSVVSATRGIIRKIDEDNERIEKEEIELNKSLNLDGSVRRTGIKMKHLARPVTSSTTLNRLHESVFHVVELLVSAINSQSYPRETLTLVSKSCISENLMLYMSPEMMSKEPCTWEKLELPHTDKPDKGLFRICKTDERKIPLCVFECKSPTLDLSAIESVDREQIMKLKEAARKKEEQTTRERTARVEVEVAVGCTSERDWNTSPRAMMSSIPENRIDLEACGGHVGDNADCIARNLDQLPFPEGSAQKANNQEEDDREDDIYIPGFSAKLIAKQFNFLFSDHEHLDTKNENYGVIRKTLYLVAQVVCQAAVSQTGLGFLYNHQSGIALKLGHLEGKERITVYVTGLIPCEKEPGNVAAMVGLSKLALDTVHDEKSESYIEKLRKMETILSKSTSKRTGLKLPRNPKSRGGGNDGNQNNSKANESGAEKKDSSDGGGSTRASSLMGSSTNLFHRDQNTPNRSRSFDFQTAETPFFLLNAPLSPTTVNVETTLDFARKVTCDMRTYNQEQAPKGMFLESKGLIGSGSTGTLLLSKWKGVEVVMKFWNRESKQTLIDLQHEVDFYSFIQEMHKAVGFSRAETSFGVAQAE